MGSCNCQIQKLPSSSPSSKCFIDEKTEAQSGDRTCLRSRGQEWQSLGQCVALGQ